MLSVPAQNGPDGQITLHATTVVIDHRALVLAGPSGTGKSTLALQMMALGAVLLADDVTWFTGTGTGTGTGIKAYCPPTLIGQIEARGVGILNAETCGPTLVSAIVDLGTPEQERLPPLRTMKLCGRDIPILHKPATSYLSEILFQYMKYGRKA